MVSLLVDFFSQGRSLKHVKSHKNHLANRRLHPMRDFINVNLMSMRDWERKRTRAGQKPIIMTNLEINSSKWDPLLCLFLDH